jgi:hypothetical protein
MQGSFQTYQCIFSASSEFWYAYGKSRGTGARRCGWPARLAIHPDRQSELLLNGYGRCGACAAHCNGVVSVLMVPHHAHAHCVSCNLHITCRLQILLIIMGAPHLVEGQCSAVQLVQHQDGLEGACTAQDFVCVCHYYHAKQADAAGLIRPCTVSRVTWPALL